MNIKASCVILIVVAALSIGLNVIQYNGRISHDRLLARLQTNEGVMRLGINSKLLGDPQNSLSDASLKLIHGESAVYLYRIDQNFELLGEWYRDLLDTHRTRLNEKLVANPDMFSRDKMNMDDRMYDRYIGWIRGNTAAQ